MKFKCEEASWWVLEFMDRGECEHIGIAHWIANIYPLVELFKLPDGRDAEMYWAENPSLAVAKPGEDEGVIGAVRRLWRAETKDEEEYQRNLQLNPDITRTTDHWDAEFALVNTKFGASKYSAVWHNPSALRYYWLLLEFPAHFRLSSVVKIGYVRDNLSNIHGGVSEN